MTYSEKLKDPRWQKKRLEILNRDEFTCQKCNDTTTTLHVHHRHYIKGYEPWDYPSELLVTLCVDCHEAEATVSSQNHKEMVEYLHNAGVFDSDMSYLGYLISESIKHFGYKKIELLLIRTAINDDLRDSIIKLLQKEEEELKRITDDPGYEL